jgi:hypothetical protein
MPPLESSLLLPQDDVPDVGKVEELAEHRVFSMRCMQIGRIRGDE